MTGKSLTVLFLKILIVFGLFWVVFIFIASKTDLLWGLRSFVILTGSMEPAIPTSSVIFVKAAKNYEVGDIITYKKANLTITHRIIEIIPDVSGLSYMVKGDANASPDSESVTQNAIIGKQIFMLPFIGKIIRLLKTLPGFISLIIIPAFIFIILELVNIKKEIEKNISDKLLKQHNLQ